MPKVLPSWALRRQIKLQSASQFYPGDIVFVDNSTDETRSHFNNGLAIVVRQFSSGDADGCMVYDNDYSLDFGPGGGESSWYPSEVMTMVRPVINR